MTRYRAHSLLPLAALAVTACAARPDAIAPVAMPAGMYDGHSCAAAAAELARASSDLAALERAQNSAATGDAIGVFLIGVPTSSLTGGDKAGEVAIAKGRVLALDARLAACRAEG